MIAASIVLDWTTGGNTQVQIEPYFMPWQVGFIPFHRVIVYPASDKISLQTDVGTLTAIDIVSNLIENERISFSGLNASARFRIDGIESINGMFFDGIGNIISPDFTVKNGALVASVECYGSAYISYYSNGTTFNYYADITGFTINTGTIYAFHSGVKGIAASYVVPPLEFVASNREDVIIIYREVIIQGANQFEMPDGATAWPDGNDYVHYPSATEDQKPVIGDAYAIQKIDRHIVFVENGGFYDDTQVPFWLNPSAPTAFIGVVWKLTNNIPTEPTETIDANMINNLNVKLELLKTEYGIA